MFEAYGGVAYPRSLFDVHNDTVSFWRYMNISLQNKDCYLSDDLVISNYFALVNISGLSLAHRMQKLWQLPHGFEGGPDGALWKMGSGHPYYNCSKYLHSQGIGKLRLVGPKDDPWPVRR